jgi:hypothetical protein
LIKKKHSTERKKIEYQYSIIRYKPQEREAMLRAVGANIKWE